MREFCKFKSPPAARELVGLARAHRPLVVIASHQKGVGKPFPSCSQFARIHLVLSVTHAPSKGTELIVILVGVGFP